MPLVDGTVFRPHQAFAPTRLFLQDLPKDRPGKILRASTRGVADGEGLTTLALIDDPAIIEKLPNRSLA